MPRWDAFLDRYRPMARALARSLAGSTSDPDDIVQEAALVLLGAVENDGAEFESTAHARNFLLRTVRNLALRARRDGGRTRPLEVEPPDDDGPSAQAVVRRQRELGRLLGQLEPDERAFLARRFLAHETLAHIATETGTAISTLHSRERALLTRLRELARRAGMDGDDA